jgi:aspartate/methionine/tyrosine aminotransferase
MNKLSQNMYINAPTLSQIAAVEAFNCEEELEGHVQKYAKNREIVLKTLESLGLLEGASPADGAFYVYVDLYKSGVTDTPSLCKRILNEALVAITPGVDFEDAESGLGLQRVRFSYSRSTEEVSLGMERFKKWWLENMTKE